MEIDLQEKTLPCLLKESVRRFAGNPALAEVDGETITYTGVGNLVQHVSRYLRQRGVHEGDRVAILSENMPHWPIAYFSILSLGAVAVPILTDFHANEIAHILKHSQCKVLFVSEKMLDKWQETGVQPENAILIDDFSLLPRQTTRERLRELIQEGRIEIQKIKEIILPSTKECAVREDDLAVIIYTSGTTGHSKGVMLTHRNIVSNALLTNSVVQVHDSDRLLSILPLSHTYECTIGLVIPILGGACIHYLGKPPVARYLLPALEKVRPTMMLTVPLIMEKIYKLRILPQLMEKPVTRFAMRLTAARKGLYRIAGKKLMKLFGGRLRFFGIGGAALAPAVERFLADSGFPYSVGYGLTETSPLISGSPVDAMRFRSSGKVLPEEEVIIHDPDPRTGEGEIWVRGPNVMKGYYEDPEKTAEVLTSEGWFRTGDLGLKDADNYLFIKGRLKNMIVGPSGENIYPEEIESVINKSPWVLESLVFEQEGALSARVHPNYEYLEEQTSRNHMTVSDSKRYIGKLLEELRGEVNGQLSSFSRIRRIIEQVEPFEKTPTQKIKRYLYVT
ncbi:MAG TPA: long-chain fatty acid--CoA ligase [bacterium]|nr:long-chain fatty acid--CoA ligase [bacterium]